MPIPREEDPDRLGLGLLLAGIQVAVYFLFVACCSFDPGFIEGRPSLGGIPRSFCLGLVVIATGVVLTAVYVLKTNRPEAAR